MHELSIAMALIDDVERAVRQDGATTVCEVHVKVGKLSGVDPVALRLAFPTAAHDGCCRNAALVITEVETRAVCNQCQTEFAPEFPFLVCETCASTDLTITGGRELMLESIQVQGEETGVL